MQVLIKLNMAMTLHEPWNKDQHRNREYYEVKEVSSLLRITYKALEKTAILKF